MSLNDEVFYEAERLSQALRFSRRQLYDFALAEFLAQYRSQHVTKRLTQVHAENDTRVDPILDALQQLSIPPDEW
jgi:hypothetical protein